MPVRILMRSEVRALAERHEAAVAAAALDGRNAHQVGLDEMDRANLIARAIGAEFGIEHHAAFLEMYLQELKALTAHTLEETEAIIQKRITEESNTSHFGAMLGGLVLFILILWALSSR